MCVCSLSVFVCVYLCVYMEVHAFRVQQWQKKECVNNKRAIKLPFFTKLFSNQFSSIFRLAFNKWMNKQEMRPRQTVVWEIKPTFPYVHKLRLVICQLTSTFSLYSPFRTGQYPLTQLCWTL